MGSFVHTLHQYIVIVVRYLVIIAVIGFMPIPLFTFFGGDSLSEMEHNPLFQYFNHYQFSTDIILESVYTNVYINENKESIKPWDVDNAILWTDALIYQLLEEHIPVVRKVISVSKPGPVQSLQAIHQQAKQGSIVPQQIQDLLMKLHEQFQNILPVDELTEDARQWVVLALNANEKLIKKQLKELIAQNPNDNFLVVTQLPTSLGKKTLKLELPEFSIKQAKRIISEELKISEKQAEILLIQNQKSLWSINEDNNEHQEFSLKSLLGQNYHPLDDILSKEEQILEQLCKSGKVKTDKKRMDLSEYGVIAKSKNYQWQNDQAKLNYMLHKGTLCGNVSWIDIEGKTQVEAGQQVERVVKVQENIQKREQKEKTQTEAQNQDKNEESPQNENEGQQL